MLPSKDLIDAKYQELIKEISLMPSDDNSDLSFGRQLNEICLSQGLSLSSIQPLPTQVEPTYQKESFKLILEGHVNQILDFVATLDQTPEPIRMDRLHIQFGQITDRVKAICQLSKISLK